MRHSLKMHPSSLTNSLKHSPDVSRLQRQSLFASRLFRSKSTISKPNSLNRHLVTIYSKTRSSNRQQICSSRKMRLKSSKSNSNNRHRSLKGLRPKRESSRYVIRVKELREQLSKFDVPASRCYSRLNFPMVNPPPTIPTSMQVA